VDIAGRALGGQMNLSEIMTRDVEVVAPDDTLNVAARKMKDLDVGFLPVCDGERLIGMLTDRDAIIRCLADDRDPKRTPVRDVMTQEVRYLFEDQDIGEAAQLMREAQIRRLPILSRNKRLVGIVTLGDLAVRTGDDQLSGQALEGVSEPTLR
jgi:CBS domain-containing protein